MKKIIAILSAVLLAVSVLAQSPEKMSYQAVIRNSSDVLVTNTTVGMQISILQGSPTGTLVYTETQTPISNANGLVSIEIGSGAGFSTIDWANGIYFIKTETDPTGGTNYTITGTSQLLSVPYALHAKTAEILTGTVTETDPVFGASVASGITGTDTANWNNKIDIEVDGSVTNEIQGITSVLTIGNDAGANSIVNVSQQGIGTSTPNASAALEINSTTQGFLPPRMNSAQMSAVTPVEGLIVYNISDSLPLYYNGAEWLKFDGTVFLYIGKYYLGGIIAYILQPGDPGYITGEKHGLIAAPGDQSAGLQWSNGGTFSNTGATAMALGTGNANTNTIVAIQGVGSYAAQLCVDLVLGGYSDWYLPSKDELNILYINKALIGGFASALYWSSTEGTTFGAWLQDFGSGSQSNVLKSDAHNVRAIRTF